MSNENNTRTPQTPHLPTGSIKAKPIALGLCMTNAKEEKDQKEQLGVQFEITAEGEHKGKVISDYLFFTEKTIDVTLKAMRAMGWKGVDVTDLSGMDHEVMLVIEHEKMTDKEGKLTGDVRARVRWINAIGIAMAKPLEGARLATFRNRINAVAARQASANGATGAAKLPPVDDVPPANEPPPWMRG